MEVVNTKNIDRILYDLPPEAKPPINGIYRLSTDKSVVQEKIAEARKKNGTWTAFQILYDLHPIPQYMMTLLETTINKDQATVVKSKKIEKGKAWFIFYGEIANNLGQSVIADFFAFPMMIDGGFGGRPVDVEDFVSDHGIDEKLYTEEISQEDVALLQELVPGAIEGAKEFRMYDIQGRNKMRMTQKLDDYEQRLMDWVEGAQNQMQLTFGEERITGIIQIRKDREERYIKAITDDSSQYLEDVRSLDKEAYLKLLTVFYNTQS